MNGYGTGPLRDKTYDEVRRLAAVTFKAGGHARSSRSTGDGSHATTATIYDGEEKIEISGEDLIDFMYVVKDFMVNDLNDAHERLTNHGIPADGLSLGDCIDLLAGREARDSVYFDSAKRR